MKKIIQTNQFKKDIKKLKKRGKDINKLQLVLYKLSHDIKLEKFYRDHSLGGNWKECRDCHIEPDWILIYSVAHDSLVLFRTGSHSDLF